MAQFSDAVVIGSRIVQEIENASPETVVARVESLVKSIRTAMDS
jgi:tryptophan synthase alpha chain